MFVIGDHGEEFNEDGRGKHLSGSRIVHWASLVPGVNNLLPRHGLINEGGWLGDLDVLPYDEVISIPVIMRVPGRTRRSKAVDTLVQMVDIAPSLIDVLGYDSERKQFQGKSLFPLPAGEEAEYSYEVFSVSQRNPAAPRYLSLCNSEWKLIRVLPGDREPRAAETLFRALERRWLPSSLLFPVGDEGHDRSRDHPEVAQEMLLDLQRWERKNPAFAEHLEDSLYEVDDRTLEHLRGLGHLE